MRAPGRTRLGLDTLGALPRPARPAVDPANLQPGIVHLGAGAFHRAHQAVYTEDALARSSEAERQPWGVVAVGQRSRRTADALRAQDGLYSVLVRGPGEVRARVVGVIRDALVARDEPDTLRAYLASATTHVVTLTVTEKGYRHDPATGRLRVDDPEVAHDLSGGPPVTPVGQLVRGLQARASASSAPLTVVVCDNVERGGELLRGLVEDFCAALPARDGARTWEWVSARVAFPSGVVDRVVPVPTDRDRADAAAALGVSDLVPVATEPYSQWVLEDDFAGPRPRWERAGVTFVDDLAPYEAAKLRLVNGTHSALAYLGLAAGCTTVAETQARDDLGAFTEQVMTRELVPTLRAAPTLDPGGYAEQVRGRFANPGIEHRLAQIAADGSHKLPQRLFGPAEERLAAGREPRLISLAVAAWLHHLCTGDVVDGRAGELVPLARQAGSAAAVVTAVLSGGQVAPPLLAADARFTGLVTEWLGRLRTDGVDATLHF